MKKLTLPKTVEWSFNSLSVLNSDKCGLSLRNHLVRMIVAKEVVELGKPDRFGNSLFSTPLALRQAQF